ncbi:hypothetical protein HOP50_01g07360 [Chloropicon primus]|uniref:Uncharacterized protein n=1 Tax=Chloropicon primus TaxID=1764295 RepID=A0A5B8MDK3_9CHLO|nr:hypothetical protein A3770_01p07520 [Chloropicon primus]UPQ97445.1 hypothetical protein HOP50_01g07360 [Chloropicon primus]|eukprot:QDZ18234.1 hypothetical protein A3770_01p07520 [Chloropicon primus]
MKTARQLRADEVVQERAKYLLEVAKRGGSPGEPSSSSSSSIPRCIAARCGHKALSLHHANALSTQRLLRRPEVLSLCGYCGCRLDDDDDAKGRGGGGESEGAVVAVKGKALRSIRKHLRSRRKKKVLLRATSRVCKLCGRKTIFKTLKREEAAA